jgi:hypothetical protein
MAGPNTHREALIAELLGDVGELLDRAEALKGSLPTAVDTALGKVRSAGDAAAGGAAVAGERFLMTFDARATLLLRGVQKAAQEAQAAATVVDRASRRFIVLAAVLGLLCGAGGGALAYFALTRVFGG